MNQKIALVGVLAGLSGLVACSNASPPADKAEANVGTKKLLLRLAADGTDLRLVESGRPEYSAHYTNPKHLADMTVRLKATGAIVSTCHDGAGAVVRCGSTPFFTSQVKIPSGTLIKVTDVHGQPCGEQQFSGTADDSASAPSSGGGGGGGGDDSSAGNDNGDDDATDDDATDDDEKDCECSGGSGSGSSSGGSGSGGSSDSTGGGGACDEATAVAMRDAFCNGVNDYLTQHGMSPIDCASLDSPITFSEDDEPKVAGAADVGCEDIWTPAYKQVSVWLKSCSADKSRATQWHEVVRWQLLQMGVCSHSPIVLDLDGDGVSASAPEQGVRFDLLGRGRAVQTAWIGGADAFLALDRDGNGRIDGAAELFGNATRGARWDDGFAALAELDTNGDGRLDAQDAAYDELVLWHDADRNGVSTSGELVTLRDAGVRALYLSAARVIGPGVFDANQNRIPLLGGYERTDGTKGAMADIFLRFKP